VGAWVGAWVRGCVGGCVGACVGDRPIVWEGGQTGTRYEIRSRQESRTRLSFDLRTISATFRTSLAVSTTPLPSSGRRRVNTKNTAMSRAARKGRFDLAPTCFDTHDSLCSFPSIV